MRSLGNSLRNRPHVLADESLRTINAFAISLLQQKTLDDLLWSIVQNVGELLGYEDCVIYLRKGDRLVRAASFAVGNPDLREHQRDFELRLGEGVVGAVAQSGVSKLVPDTRQEPTYVPDDFAGLSELAVPILFEGQTLGVLDTESAEVGAYDEGDRATLQFIANIAASRIASALADLKRQKIEEQRAGLLKELAAKNSELERFTYTVTHDLKAPLITIQGFLGLLEADIAAGDSARIEDDLGRIRAGAAQMLRLLNDLLALSRVGRVSGTIERVALSELVKEAVARVDGRIQQSGARLSIDDELPKVLGDRRQLLAVFQNLIDNAVKFLGDQLEPRIEIGQRPSPHESICFVRDNGIGVDKQYQEQIFGLFNRLSQDVEGTGIGLALVQRIVELHGGRIWLESDGEGTGSTFCVALPAHALAPEE